MAIRRAPFGARYSLDKLKSYGLELTVSPHSKLVCGAKFEIPCRINTPLNDLLGVGAFSYINGKGRFTNVRIGRYCSIAAMVSIGFPEHPVDWLSTSPIQYMRPSWAAVTGDWTLQPFSGTKETVIENDVWIGVGAFLRTGVTIGTGAIIGAQAVVTKDVEPYAIVGGNPAKKIRSRVPEDLIPELLETRWWDYSPSQLNGCPFNDLPSAVEFIRHLRNTDAPVYKPRSLVITDRGAELSRNDG